MQKATPEEYAPLKKELERIGYKLIIKDDATKEDLAVRQETIKGWQDLTRQSNRRVDKQEKKIAVADTKTESKIIKKPLPKISEATHDGGSAIHVKVFVEGELRFEEIFDDAETAAKNVIELFDGVTDKNIDDAKKNGTMEFEHNGKKHKIVFTKTTRRDFSNREKNID